MFARLSCAKSAILGPAAAAVVAIAALGAPACAESPETSPAGTAATDTGGKGLPDILDGRVRGMLTISAAHEADSLEDLTSAERVEAGGDLRFGRWIHRGHLDPSALTPETSGKISVRAFIGLEGQVLSASVENGVAPDVDRAFEQFVLGYKFEPSVHKTRGPLLVEVVFHFRIRRLGESEAVAREALSPERDRSRMEDGRLVATFARAFVEEGGYLPPWPGQPKSVAASRASLPTDLPVDWRYDAIAFLLVVDKAGDVAEVNILDTRALAPNEEEIRRLFAGHLGGLEFETLVHPEHGPVVYGVIVDFRIENGFAELLLPVEESPDARKRFEEHYRLAENRTLDLIPPPFIPERVEVYRATSPAQQRLIARAPDRMTFGWTNDGLDPLGGSRCFGCRDLGSLLRALDFQDFAIRGEPELLDKEVVGDLIRRVGADRRSLLSDLEVVLRERYGLAIALELRTELTPSIVMRGRLGEIEKDPELGGRPYLHIYNDEQNPDPRRGAGGGPSPTIELLANFLGYTLNMPVIDETVGGVDVPFGVKVHNSAHRTEAVENVLRNLEEQSDLEFSIERRPIEILYVSSASEDS